MADYEKTKRTTLKRAHERGSYDRDAVHAILDEALICHVAFIHDGAPAIIPTAHWREGETFYIHGSAASRMIRALEDGAPACIEVTMTDGLVLARSGYHSSVNYRTVVIYATGRKITDEAEKLASAEGLHGKDRARPLGRTARPQRAGNEGDHGAGLRSERGVGQNPRRRRRGRTGRHERPGLGRRCAMHRTFGRPSRTLQLRGDIGLPGYLKNYTGPG